MAEKRIAAAGGARTGPFRRTDRLLRRHEFTRVSGAEGRGATAGFVVLVAGSPDGVGPRLGITMSRRVGGAVVRNRLKRRVREWFRRRRASLAAVDLVVIGRASAASLSTAEVEEMLDAAAARAGVA